MNEAEFVFDLPGKLYRLGRRMKQDVGADVKSILRDAIPFEHKYILQAAAQERMAKVLRAELKRFTAWFSEEYMTWLFPDTGWQADSPSCPIIITAAGKKHRTVRCGLPMKEEMLITDEPTRTEQWRCVDGHELRFPRYTDVLRILKERKGRCGEYAQLFTALLNAVGFRARLVVDFMNDHVWTEVYTGDYWKDAWMHIDPSDNEVDEPLRYHNFGKNMLYIVAIGSDGQAHDVTERYTRKENWWRERTRHLDNVFLTFMTAHNAEVERPGPGDHGPEEGA